MRRAIALARPGVGRTGDNPSVGCVILGPEGILGEGATAEGGRPHAEELALAAAGEAARDAVALVTLEPCARRSGVGIACTDRLIAAGVRRVVIACDDASVFAAGDGSARLRAAGIEVETGLLEAEARALYAGYRPAS
ncbi:riboflavin biosynthesis protein RibD [Phenylobacterium parvum]|uniref:Riboflavin biosynthesis protein RibD n=2 Tax=Phenylobacterium parvum TaxID=2201350 RepID=A0A2Z3I035_9CAUL|nr:riboflavin biosynthesis protein RibD [Phenylobacterium parvum]